MRAPRLLELVTDDPVLLDRLSDAVQNGKEVLFFGKSYLVVRVLGTMHPRPEFRAELREIVREEPRPMKDITPDTWRLPG